MLSPKRTKYRKARKGRVRGYSSKCKEVHFGKYGLQSLKSGRITAQQIEATRRAINRKIKRMGQLWIRVFPDIPVTSKPTEVRMGKGKGSFDHWMCRVRSGRILFELDGVSLDLAKEAFRCGAGKLPIPTKFVQATSTLKNEELK